MVVVDAFDDGPLGVGDDDFVCDEPLRLEAPSRRSTAFFRITEKALVTADFRSPDCGIVDHQSFLDQVDSAAQCGMGVVQRPSAPFTLANRDCQRHLGRAMCILRRLRPPRRRRREPRASILRCGYAGRPEADTAPGLDA